MTDSRNAAMIVAQYTDCRAYRGLGVVRITCELDVKDEALVHKTIGYPEPGKALILSVANPEVVKAFGLPPEEPPARKKREPVPFDELRPSQQAGILCADPEFQEWIRRGWRDYTRDMSGEGAAAHIVRIVCGVESRSELNTNRRAGELWKEVVVDFRDWQHTDARYKGTLAYERRERSK